MQRLAAQKLAAQRLGAQRLAVRARALAAATLLIAAAAQSAAAQTVEQFYKGRQLTMLVFTGPGSTYDIYARVLARHFGDHIPGKPVVVVQNMLGAGGLKVEQYIYRIAPNDGTVVGTIGRGLPFEPMLGENEVNVDPLKFTWLGSMNRDVSLAMSWHTSKIKTFADLQQYQLLVPGTGAGADSEILPLAFNRLAGTQFKIIEGYRDTPIAALAMERGELDGLAYWSWSSIMAAHPDWIRDKKVNLLFQTGLNPIPDVSQVPSLRNLVTNPTDKAALAKTLSTLNVTTSVGKIDFNKSPMPNVIATSPILGMQWVKADAGSKFKLKQVVTENAGDPNVPVTHKLIPYS